MKPHESEGLVIVHGVLSQLTAYVATAKRHNTANWMRGLALRINRANECLGDDSRVQYRPNAERFEIYTPEAAAADEE